MVPLPDRQIMSDHSFRNSISFGHNSIALYTCVACWCTIKMC